MILPRDLLRRCGAALADQTAFIDGNRRRTWGDMDRRKKFLIITGGYNVYPVTVEAVLAEHPAMREVAVVGAPHRDWGEAAVAIVSLKPGQRVTAQELLEFCRPRLGGFERPKHVVFMDELPKGATGKIAKASLRDGLRNDPASLPWPAA